MVFVVCAGFLLPPPPPLAVLVVVVVVGSGEVGEGIETSVGVVVLSCPLESEPQPASTASSAAAASAIEESCCPRSGSCRRDL